MKKRIWELDAARGLCILGMVIVHLLYDLQNFFGWIQLSGNPLFSLLLDWGGVLFFLISGICATLGSRPVRRGVIVFLCGMLVTAVTYGMYYFRFAGYGMIIWFGVLHCLGICMLLWPLVRRLPVWAMSILAAGIIAAGLYIQNIRVAHLWLMPLGFITSTFASSDYFPLLPFFGFFLLGAVLGKTLYKSRESLLPKADPAHPIIGFFTFLGKWSLPIYLLHQPVLTGILTLITML